MKRKLIQNINNDFKRIKINNNSYICLSNTCNHKNNNEIKDYDTITSLDELIILGSSYSCKNFNVYKGINLRILNDLVPILTELNDMVGLEQAKQQIITHILYFIRGLASNPCDSCIDCELNIPCIKNIKDMFHTVITGPPGVGKTTFAKILGKIYCKLGKSQDKFNIVSRSQLVSGYLGRTAKKTQKVINKSVGGVLFIDEAYSLGNTGDQDSYSKECIDTLNLNLSENRDFICIIAGYKEELENCFFGVNPGLERRFPFRYNIEPYNYDELVEILIKKLENDNWEIQDKNYLSGLIESNYNYFNHYGGSMEILMLNIKLAQATDINSINKIINNNILNKGLELFITNKL
jgi:SpoVK/Ycf46/Vps4 family AAA+-type ATPase